MEIESPTKTNSSLIQIEKSPSEQSDIIPEKMIGRRLEYLGSFGTIKYCGPLLHVPESKDTSIWLGVQWDDPTRGKHNGLVNDHQYFTTDDGLNSGSLLKADKVNLGINIYDGIHFRYFRQEKDKLQLEGKENEVQNARGMSVEYDEEAYFETIKKFKKKVEFIGFNKIWKKVNDLQHIKELSVPDLNISELGPEETLKKIIPNVRVLSLERNLICDWNQLYQMGNEIVNLEQISVSGNRLNEPEDVRTLDKIYVRSSDSYIPIKPTSVFANLKTAILINMNLTWKTLTNVLPAFKNVEEFVICRNKCNDFENLVLGEDEFQNLKFLNLEENGIYSFEPVLNKFNHLQKLEKITLNKNSLRDFGKVTGFSAVKTIILEENEFKDFRFLTELNQFPKLENIRITNNPISKAHNPLHIRQRAIAEIRNLKIVNGSELKKYERKDCEIYYVRKAFEDYFLKSKEVHYDYDLDKFMTYANQEYPRVAELIQLFGNPYEITPKMKEEVKSSGGYDSIVVKTKPKLLKLQFYALSGPYLGKPVQVKKYSDNTLITNLKSIVAKQFGMSADKIRLSFKLFPKDPLVQLEDDLKDLYFYGVKDGSEIFADDSDGN